MDKNPVVEGLIKAFEADAPHRKGDHQFSVSRTVSAFAVLYEKARNAVEFRAEHLVRRAAIERILKRRIALESDPQVMAENITLELLWAKYIDSSLLDQEIIHTVADIIRKYLFLKHTAFGSGAPRYHNITWTMLIGVASAEIDETIVSADKRQALTNFVYQSLRPKICLTMKDPQDINMLTYIAVERTFAQSDDALIIYHLLCMFMPDWQKAKELDTPTVIHTIQTIKRELTSPVVGAIGRYMRKHLPPFLLLRDFFFEQGKQARGIIEDETKFEEVLTLTAQRRYEQIGQKVRRAIIRSIIYIFLTKMVLALALETPVDLFIVKRIDYIPLAINALFPPILLFLLASFITIPGPDNTKKLIEKIKLIVYHFSDYQHLSDTFTPQDVKKRPIMSAVFTIFYMIAFIVSFGAIAFTLNKLHFNFASQIIFVFFIALVSLFAYRIRQSAREYEIVDRQGILEPVIDFFFLPILWAGDLLSKEIAKVNFFIFIFDFILEAPLKVIFQLVEEWIRFIRTKREEIV